jgi:GNAT superfamily N-acetyltransferase
VKLESFTKTIPTLIANGELRTIFGEGISRLYSKRTQYLLRRDLSVPLDKRPQSKIPITIREMRKQDIPLIIKPVVERLPAINAGLRTLYLAVTESGEICYMQWLIDNSQNHLRPSDVGLVLQPDDVLLEWAYTFEKFRGQGIMACAMAQIAELGIAKGARWAMTLVDEDNIASLKGCRNAGFRPYKMHEEKWLALRQQLAYTPLPEGARYSFETE